MSEPRRMLEDPSASGLARELLASAEPDHSEPGARGAVAKRLGIAAGALVVSSQTSAAAVATALWWKLGVVALLVGGGLTFGIAMRSSGEQSPAPVSAPVAAPVAASAPVAAPAPEIVAAAPVAVPAQPEALPAAPVEASTSSKSTHASAPAPHPRAAPADPAPAVTPAPAAAVPPAPEVAAPIEVVDPRQLAAEVALLDRARAKLRAADFAGALAEIDRHGAEFADGALRAEAAAVRIETYVAAGRSAEAREAADRFLSSFPQSPLTRRVRALVERTKETP